MSDCSKETGLQCEYLHNMCETNKRKRNYCVTPSGCTEPDSDGSCGSGKLCKCSADTIRTICPTQAQCCSTEQCYHCMDQSNTCNDSKEKCESHSCGGQWCGDISPPIVTQKPTSMPVHTAKPTPTQRHTQAPASHPAACRDPANPHCNSLSGDCCPAPDGMWLACCPPKGTL